MLYEKATRDSFRSGAVPGFMMERGSGQIGKGKPSSPSHSREGAAGCRWLSSLHQGLFPWEGRQTAGTVYLAYLGSCPHRMTTCVLPGCQGGWLRVSGLSFAVYLRMTLNRILIPLPPLQCAGITGMSHTWFLPCCRDLFHEVKALLQRSSSWVT